MGWMPIGGNEDSKIPEGRSPNDKLRVFPYNHSERPAPCRMAKNFHTSAFKPARFCSIFRPWLPLTNSFQGCCPSQSRKTSGWPDLIDTTFKAYNAARLGEACRLFVEKMLAKDGTVGMTLTGALTPAGLGRAAIVPLMKAGFVDWIVSTGANLYHDLHYGLGMELFAGSPFVDDIVLRNDGVIRIYDVLFSYDVLLDTDAFVRQVIAGPEFPEDDGHG